MAKKINLITKQSKNKQDNVFIGLDIQTLKSKLKENIPFIVAILILILAPIYYFGVLKPNKIKEEQEIGKDLYQAEFLFQERNFDNAINGDNTYEGFIEVYDKYNGTNIAQLATLYLGIIYAQRKEYKSAINWLQKFKIEGNILYSRSLCLMGDMYLQQGQHNEALSHYVSACKDNPNKIYSPRYFLKMALVYRKLGDKKEAIDSYKEIIKLYPDTTEAIYARKKIISLDPSSQI